MKHSDLSQTDEQVFADAVDDPDIAHPGGDCRAEAIGEEVEAAEPHPRAIGVVQRCRDRLDDKGAVGAAES